MMMKIAFFLNIFPLLSETFILSQITALLDRGHDVDIFAYTAGNQEIAHSDIYKYRLISKSYYYGKNIETMPKNFFIRAFNVFNIVFRNRNPQLKNLISSMNFFKFRSEAISLRMFYKSYAFSDVDLKKYDIIHCHFGPSGNLGAQLKALKLAECKLITTFYGYDITSYVTMHGAGKYKLLFRVADYILCLSNKMKQLLVENGCPIKKIVIHPLGIKTEKFKYNEKIINNKDQINIISIGRLVEKKGIEYAVRAVSSFSEKATRIQYTIIGDGPLRKEIEQLIRESNAENFIRIVGWKSQEELVKIMEKADIMIAPSVTAKDGDQEGTPAVLMEAMASGVLVLSTFHGGIPEIIENEKSGFLVPERNNLAISEKLKQIVKSRNEWNRIRKCARQHVLDNHDIDKLADKLVSLYRHSLG